MEGGCGQWYMGMLPSLAPGNFTPNPCSVSSFLVCHFDPEDPVEDSKSLEVGSVMGWKNARFLKDSMEQRHS